MDALQQASYKAAEAMYRAAGPAAEPASPDGPGPASSTNGHGTAPGNGNGKGVIDAEFEEAK